MERFSEVYHALFDTELAQSDNQIKLCQQLRYQTYVKEKKWEPEHPSLIERDEFDCRSAHLLLFYRPTNQAIGTVRIILPNLRNPQASYPLQSCCRCAPLYHPSWIKSHPELSRFAIPKLYRNDYLQHPATQAQFCQHRITDIVRGHQILSMGLSFGLIAAAINYAKDNRFLGYCVIIEPSLLRLLRNAGINIQCIGPKVNFHGIRQPCMIKVHPLSDLFSKNTGLLYQIVMQQLQEAKNKVT